MAVGTGAALCLSAVPASAASAPAAPAHHQTCAEPPLPPQGAPLVVDPSSAAAPAGLPHRPDRAELVRLRAAVDNYVACLDGGDQLHAATLFSPYFVESFMGQQSYYQVPAILGGLTVADLRIDAVDAYADGSFVTEVHYLAYGHRLAHERLVWWPDPADGFLKVDGLQALASPIPHPSATLNVRMGEYFFDLDRHRLRAPHGDLVLRLNDVGRERHEAILLRLPPGKTGADILTGGVTQDQAVTIGQDNGAQELSLVNVRPGVYTLVDFIPAPDGLPHLAHGQTAQFTVVP
ncbi:hypothetical protein GCM10023322_44220 [Rugosimonospora acidiphila]|uniref:DUF4399 domain-containing protein n=1 Tax=Rugosimonospora acidiphila TaxID=556531 RepID=A0ABP9S151_9ACTN